MTDKILAFIPCYNCAPQIGRVLQQFRGPVAARIHEVLVLDNGSRDDSVARADWGWQARIGLEQLVTDMLENVNVDVDVGIGQAA